MTDISKLKDEVCGAFSLNRATESEDKAAAVKQAIDWIYKRYEIVSRKDINPRTGQLIK